MATRARRRIGIIGFGAISSAVAACLAAERDADYALAVLLRAQANRAAQPPPEGCALLSDEAELVQFAPDLVIEAAGHEAVRTHVASLLGRGIPVLMSSVGALHDDALRQRIVEAAEAGGARLILPSGALAAVDYVRAVRGLDGLLVQYESRKSVRAWRDELTALGHDPDTIDAPITLLEGTAREAAARFPANLNVAATLAIAADGFEAVQVRVVADPHVDSNCHIVTVSSAAGTMRAEISNRPSPANPKSSAIVASALVAAVRQFFAPIQVL